MQHRHYCMYRCHSSWSSSLIYFNLRIWRLIESVMWHNLRSYVFFCFFFPWIRLGAQRWSWTTWTQSLPRSLFSTTILRWCRRWNFLCMILTMTRMTWVMTISSGSLNVPWARWASLCTVLKENFVRSSPYSLFCDNVIVCVQIVSNRQMTRPLMLNNHRPAGHGTITVSGLIFSFISNALAVAGAPSVWT